MYKTIELSILITTLVLSDVDIAGLKTYPEIGTKLFGIGDRGGGRAWDWGLGMFKMALLKIRITVKCSKK